MKHTPGPWRAGWGRYIPITATVKGESAQIGRAESCGQIPDEEVEANADLFAAAPVLLDALIRTRDLLLQKGVAFATADHAIAKATGGAA